MEIGIGDRVKAMGYVGNGNSRSAGLYGTVVTKMEDGGFGVGFDKNINGHDCGGHAKIGHGWWVYACEITKISNKITIMKKLSNFIKKTVDGDTQELLKAGYINGDLEPTDEGKNRLGEILWFANLPAIVALAKEANLEAEKESNK